VRAAVNSNKHDGYIVPSDGSTPTSDADDWTSRVSLLGGFTDDVSLLLTVTNGHLGGEGSGSVNWDTLQGNPTGQQAGCGLRRQSVPKLRRRYVFEFRSSIQLGRSVQCNSPMSAATSTTRPTSRQASTNNPLGNTPPPCPCFVAGPPAYTWLHQGSHTLTDSHEPAAGELGTRICRLGWLA